MNKLTDVCVCEVEMLWDDFVKYFKAQRACLKRVHAKVLKKVSKAKLTTLSG